MSAPLLTLEGVTRDFTVRRGLWGTPARLRAVDEVTLHVARGETLGIVGESGCGKSTLARLVVRLIEPSAGAIRLDGTDIAHLPQSVLRPMRRRVQMVFQDPNSSLDPRMGAGDLVAEPLRVHRVAVGTALEQRVAELFASVGLRPDQRDNLPAQFSGGQRQRLAIARALALDPDLVVADEPVSALDLSIRAQIVNLMLELQAARGLAYLFIAHDLGLVRHVSDRIAVMYLGRVVETGPAEPLFRAARHPYTRLLLEAVPRLDRRRRGASPHEAGEVPSPLHPPLGCAFHPRCPRATALCREERPTSRPVGDGVEAACHHPVH